MPSIGSIDPPHAGARLGVRPLLREDAVAGSRGVDPVDDQPFARDVDLGHHVGRRRLRAHVGARLPKPGRARGQRPRRRGARRAPAAPRGRSRRRVPRSRPAARQARSRSAKFSQANQQGRSSESTRRWPRASFDRRRLVLAAAEQPEPFPDRLLRVIVHSRQYRPRPAIARSRAPLLGSAAMAADTISFARGAPSADILPVDAVREARGDGARRRLGAGALLRHRDRPPGPLRSGSRASSTADRRPSR